MSLDQPCFRDVAHSGLSQMMASTSKKSRPVEPVQQGAGLKMAAHPLLLDNTPAAPQSKKDRYKPMQPKFASIKVNFGIAQGSCQL